MSEQDELDQHDAIVADLTIRLESLTLTCSFKEDSAAHRVASRTLANLRERTHPHLRSSEALRNSRGHRCPRTIPGASRRRVIPCQINTKKMLTSLILIKFGDHLGSIEKVVHPKF